MGLFEKIFPPRAVSKAEVVGFFKAFTSYAPVFTSRAGGIYEMELTRAAIHAKAKHRSKLKPELVGSAKPALKPLLQFQPNPFMDTTKYLYRLSTILDVDTTAFIVPLTDPTGLAVTGYFPILPSRAEVVDIDGEPWLRYTFSNGQKAAIEFSRVGILTEHQYRDDFFGEGHGALAPTLDLVDLQRQGMSEAVKNSAVLRFLARLAGTYRPEDIKAERDRWSAENMSSDNTSGVAMFDAKYADVKQIESKPWLVDAEQMKLIQTNVCNYFGVNEAILQNSYDEDGWNAFYEGEVEGFALQLGLVMSNMTFSDRERAYGNAIMFSSNRLQYASNATKVNVVTQLTDRALMSNWQACDVFNLPYPKDADGNVIPERWVIRGEYIDISNLPDHTVDAARSYLKPPAATDPNEVS
jgi:hypothetical protein